MPRSCCTCVENKVAQPSASWLSGGVFQHQSMPSLGCSKPRPASENQQLGQKYRCLFDILLHAVHELDGGLFPQQLGCGSLHQGCLCAFTSVWPAGVPVSRGRVCRRCVGCRRVATKQRDNRRLQVCMLATQFRQTDRQRNARLGRGRPKWSSGGQTHIYPSPNAARTRTQAAPSLRQVGSRRGTTGQTA